MKRSHALLCCGLAAALTGCAGGKVNYVKPDFNGPDFVAMLPPNNLSNDLMAPRAALGAMSSAMIGLGYFPITSPVHEEILRKLGMTDGGQVNAFKLADLAKALGTDGIAVTTINDFNKINLGFYISPTVDCSVVLHDDKGERLWEAQAKFTEKKINIDPQAALQAAVGEMVGDAIGKMFKTHLIMESQKMAGIIVQTCSMNKPSLAYPGPLYMSMNAPAAAGAKSPGALGGLKQ
ncbi:MAG: GNA1162 family protein [Elusimicrobiota bacterium]